MTLILTVIAFIIGLAVIVYGTFKLGSLMPFSVPQMRARRERIEQALQTAEQAERRLAEVRAEIDAEIARAREQAGDIVARARREAVVVTEESATRARAEAAAFLERTRSDIGVERERAVAALRQELSELVVEGAGAVIRDALDEQAHRRLIDTGLESVGASDGGGSDGR